MIHDSIRRCLRCKQPIETLRPYYPDWHKNWHANPYNYCSYACWYSSHCERFNKILERKCLKNYT